MSKVCVVTGGSSGIGLATAKAMAQKGFQVYSVSRRTIQQSGIHSLSADVTDEKAIHAVIEQIFKEAGSIDVLINCAGFGISGAVEFTAEEDAKHQFDVNFFGTVNSVHAVLPLMRRQGHGRIVNISSVAGAIPIPFQTYYSACKAAINSYTMALANEVRPFGIEVCCVQPGDICTGFTAAREKFHEGDDVYQGRISRSVASMEKDEQNGMKPETAGAFIARVATHKRVQPLNTVGFSYQFLYFIAKLLPAKALNYFVGKLYAK